MDVLRCGEGQRIPINAALCLAILTNHRSAESERPLDRGARFAALQREAGKSQLELQHRARNRHIPTLN